MLELNCTSVPSIKFCAVPFFILGNLLILYVIFKNMAHFIV